VEHDCGIMAGGENLAGIGPWEWKFDHLWWQEIEIGPPLVAGIGNLTTFGGCNWKFGHLWWL